MMENQPPLTSPGGSSNRNPPEGCTGPLYSQDCPQEDPTFPHHYQGGKPENTKAEEELKHGRFTEEGDIMRTIIEEETYVRSDQQTMEEGDTIRTNIPEDEEPYVRSNRQSMEEGDLMRTNKEEETYMRSDQQSTEERESMRTIKQEEEETYVRSNQQPMEENIMMVIIKEEEFSEDVDTGQNNVWSTSDEHLTSLPDDNAEDNSVTQSSPGENPITGNFHHRAYSPDRGTAPSSGEESDDTSQAVTSSLHPPFPRDVTTTKPCNRRGSSRGRPPRVPARNTERFPCTECSKRCKSEAELIAHQKMHVHKRPFSCAECGKCFRWKSELVRHKRVHTGEKPFLCSRCKRSFSDKGSLRSHFKLHTG
ncbi:zinc finger protein 7-like isoform X2 [Hyperolius riggenbachi]|uniref:zinc finger protein 7-like isoform X2 n=1 Tax=Hyperolius riggenbachi TaxID=752182 RepID=UPI0035A379D1